LSAKKEDKDQIVFRSQQTVRTSPTMGQSLSNEAGQAKEVDGDGPWKRESDQETYRGRGEADPAASQPLPDPREVAKRYR